MQFEFSNELVLITGGAGILGQKIAESFSENNAKVILVDCNEKELMDAFLRINKTYPESIFPFVVDITKKENLANLNKEIKKNFGTVSILVNNAATKSENFFSDFESFPIEDWNHVMEVNVTALMMCCQIFGNEMAKKEKGSIVNISSIYGVVAPDQRIYEGSLFNGSAINTPAVYSTSKSAVLGLTRYLSTYWGKKHIRVNAVTPGGIYSGQNETFVNNYSNRVPLARMAKKEEICSAILFLASECSSYITGQNIIVDGGLTAW